VGPAFVLILQLGVSSPRETSRASNLTAAAQASGRPRECAAAPRGAATKWGPSVWEAAREPNLERYCDLLARGFGQLLLTPETALETADVADRAAPGHAAPSVLRGRAYAMLKLWPKAAVELERARAIDSRSLEDPLTLREWARALAATERAREALAAYRTLGPRVSILPSPEERARTFLEAAELAFSLGPPTLDDAIAFLGEAKQLGVRELEWRVSSELALAFDRRGAKDEAAGLVIELARRFRKEAKTHAISEYREAQAAAALVLESVEPRLAIETWERYVTGAGPRGPWVEHAQKRIEALRKKGRGG
jgi:tetratricopeptide (TPR) repeat protein